MIPMTILAIENEVDRSFMEQIYFDYRKLMFSEVLKIINNSWDAEEIVQTAMVSLVEQVNLLKTLPRNKRTNYIITVSKNAAFSLLRKKGKEKTISLDDEENSLYNQLASTEEIDAALIRNATSEELYIAWHRINQRNQQVLAWKYFLSHTDEQIADELHVKPNSVRMILSRARQDLFVELKRIEQNGN